jgi:Na+/melibiose symporter-like transporter
VLDIVGYDANATVQTPGTIATLKILVAVVPAILTILGIMVARGFRIGRAGLEGGPEARK